MSKKKHAQNRGYLLGYLRVREGLSQNQLANKVGLKPIDICRFEKGKMGRVWKYRRLAEFFGVSVDTLVRDDIRAVVVCQTKQIETNHRRQTAFQRKEELKIKVGLAGEDIVADAERACLAGTMYANAVNPCYAEQPDAGFDILSFSQSGQPRYIEVKTTNQARADVPFIMTANEIDFMKRCRAQGLNYEIHRVYALTDSQDWKREIYTAMDMEEFEFIPKEYLVRRRKK